MIWYGMADPSSRVQMETGSSTIDTANALHMHIYVGSGSKDSHCAVNVCGQSALQALPRRE